MESLRISLCQTDLVWEDAQKNLENLESLFREIEQTDLIFLPEMFTTGFSMQSAVLAEDMRGATVQWMRNQAKSKDAVICGSIIIKEDSKYFNRQLWVQPNGEVFSYDKRHLFRMAGEHEHFTAGSQRLIVDLKGWKIMPLICYDLRFPVWGRNKSQTDRKTYARAEYDVLLFNANWPEVRIEAWKKLLAARAIENQAYVVGVNRVGVDGQGLVYSGGSQLIDAKGEVVWEANDYKVAIKTIGLNATKLKDFRNKFPVGMDGDDFSMSI